MPSICRSALAAVALALLASSSVSAQNLDCTLQLPANPLSAQGLATPYILAGNNPPITQDVAGPCNQATFIQRTFVQGAILDPATGVITLYDPLVIDQGTRPAVQPQQPALPNNAVVGLWFGNNANTLTLLETNNPGALAAGKCVNGIARNGGKVEVFGEFAYCNAPAFFRAANAAIRAGKLQVPNLGTYNVPAGTNAPTNRLPNGANFTPTQVPAQQNVPCPTVRSFGVIDQDQSDNMVTSYLLTPNGATAQDSPANRQQLRFGQNNGAVQIVNASDNRLISVALAAATGCQPMTAMDLVQGAPFPSFPLNELQAAAKQRAPVALVPANDPMVTVLGDTTQDLAKVNLYRAGVNQPPVNNLARIAGTAYCLNFAKQGPIRTVLDAPLTRLQPSPVPTVGDSLYTFLVGRLNGAYGLLGCDKLLNTPVPFQCITNADGVVLAGNIDPAFTAALQKFIQNQQKMQAAAAAAAKAAKAKAAAAKAAAGKAAAPAAKAAAAKAAAAAGKAKAAAAQPMAVAGDAAAQAAVQAGQDGIAAALQAAADGTPESIAKAIAALQAAQQKQAALAANLQAQQTTAVADSEELSDEIAYGDDAAAAFDAIADIPADLDYLAEGDAFDQPEPMPDTPEVPVPDVALPAADTEVTSEQTFSADFANNNNDDASNAPAADEPILALDDATPAPSALVNSAADSIPTCTDAPAAVPSEGGFSGLWFGVGGISMLGLLAVVGAGAALAKRKLAGFTSTERENMQTIHAAQSDSV